MQADRMAAGGAQDTSNSHSSRPLLALGVAVVLAHLVALQQLPAVLAPPDLAQTRAFTTRSIVVQPPQAPVAAAPEPAPPPPPPPPRRRPRPAPAAEPPPAPAAEAPIAMAAPEPAAAQPDPAAAPAEEAASQPEPPAPAASAPEAGPAPAPAPAPAPEPAAPPAPATALALGIPGSVRLKYTLTGEAKQQTYHALGELLWLQDGKTYDARLEYSAFLIGSRVRTSSGKLSERGLEPARFSDKWRKRDLAAHFERDKGIVSFSANTPSAPLLPDAQDQLSVLLQLSSMVAGDPARFGAGASITLPVVGPRDADVWTFTMQGEELSYLPYDNLQTWKLMRNPRKEFDQKVEAWLAPSLAYMPVRVRITQPNGDFVDQLLRSVDSP
ncbi:DUF3108 domain-containing protein [Pseudorhodoferax soli]|uniref:DUF3108 domain-containing protein n=1 Tax=Pseudorhodoferax soli TaxID=545864 RepID=UPI001FE6B6B1|nr:DUF3108 domain-containing protein [Pseudorhodoferax soli]